MDQQTTGIVVSAAKQWWLKVNTKPIRKHALEGAVFPYIIKVKYTVDGNEFIKRKWIRAGQHVPAVGSSVVVAYDADHPRQAKVLSI